MLELTFVFPQDDLLFVHYLPANILQVINVNLRRLIYSISPRIFSLSKHLGCWRACVVAVAACRIEYNAMRLHSLLPLLHDHVVYLYRT